MSGVELGQPVIDSRQMPQPRDPLAEGGVNGRRQAPRADQRPQSGEVLGVEGQGDLLFGHGR
jgi:hypothetical protein